MCCDNFETICCSYKDISQNKRVTSLSWRNKYYSHDQTIITPIFRHETRTIAWRQQVLLRITRSECEMALNLKVSPEDVDVRIKDVTAQIDKTMEGKLTRNMMAPLLGRKCQKEDLDVCPVAMEMVMSVIVVFFWKESGAQTLQELNRIVETMEANMADHAWMNIPPAPDEMAGSSTFPTVQVHTHTFICESMHETWEPTGSVLSNHTYGNLNVQTTMNTDDDDIIDVENLQERIEQIEIAIDIVRGRGSLAPNKRIPSTIAKRVRNRQCVGRALNTISITFASFTSTILCFCFCSWVTSPIQLTQPNSYVWRCSPRWDRSKGMDWFMAPFRFGESSDFVCLLQYDQLTSTKNIVDLREQMKAVCALSHNNRQWFLIDVSYIIAITTIITITIVHLLSFEQ